jgi:Uma2 family endonuclease
MATADLTRPHAPNPPRDPAPRLWTADEFTRIRGLGLFPGQTLSLDRGVLVESDRPVVFTRKEYYALDDAGFFRWQRVQLIGGVIVQESPMNPPHATSVRKVTRALEHIFTDGYDVRVQLPIDLGLISEPHPDVAVVIGSIDDFAVEHPKSAVLVVEVSDTTFAADTHEKASLYAAGGILDYWVIDLVRGQLLVFRDPRPSAADAFGHTFAGLTAHDRDGTVTPLAAASSPVRVSELLP